MQLNREDASQIYERITDLQIPFMAGSSVPLMWRDPWCEFDPSIVLTRCECFADAQITVFFLSSSGCICTNTLRK